MVDSSPPKAAEPQPDFTKLIDLASSRLGGLPIYANDEFFAEKENLVLPGRGVFIADKYTDRGKWMDGWESRRKRGPGHDWCVIRLGLPGAVRGVDIDTNHFLGNHPPFASVDGLNSDRRLVSNDAFDKLPWTELLPKTALKPGSQNFFQISSTQSFTHLRLNIYPDGGVARFRAYGEVRTDFSKLAATDVVDLAAVENGGSVLSCNDMFFGPKDNLVMPGRGVNMGDGWETKRKRSLPGHDWVVVQLGAPGELQRLVVDTCHFKGNFPDRCSVEGKLAPGAAAKDLESDAGWQEVLAETNLQGHHIHSFAAELRAKGPFTHVRLKIFPDGGVSRFRVFGTLARR